jgi:hypothetical protein
MKSKRFCISRGGIQNVRASSFECQFSVGVGFEFWRFSVPLAHHRHSFMHDRSLDRHLHFLRAQSDAKDLESKILIADFLLETEISENPKKPNKFSAFELKAPIIDFWDQGSILEFADLDKSWRMA